MKKLSTEDFIEQAKLAHGDKYDYSKVKYVNNKIKVCVICKQCGTEFWQKPNNHTTQKQGCPNCYGTPKKTTEDFIEKAKVIHGDKYDYSKVEYKGNKTKVCIICHEHGEFWQIPNDHLSGYGCSKCCGTNKKTTKDFIEQAKVIHGDKYDYSKVEYINNSTKVCITCHKHGGFWQIPSDHLRGCGCSECNNSKGEERIKLFLDENNINYIHDKACLKFLGQLRPDFYLPDYNMIVEYDGKQHFESVNVFGGEESLKLTKERDNRKNTLCEENNVKLVRISYEQINDIDSILVRLLY